jgi:hypothetical protein
MNTDIKKEYIFRIFANLKIGTIGRIRENPHFKNPNKKRIMIEIEFNKTAKANYMKTRLINDQPIFLIYENPWFWKIVKSNK